MYFVNELFIVSNMGKDLKLSLLILFNKMKNSLTIPEMLRKVFVTAINKKKKSPLNLENMRGIFLVPKLRVIFLKLIYNSIIGDLKRNLSSSNIGAKKQIT